MPHPIYPSLGPGQPPQLRTPVGRAFCIKCGSAIRYRVPQRPFCIKCWNASYRAKHKNVFRHVLQAFCHQCGRVASVSYGEVHCKACRRVPALAR